MYIFFDVEKAYDITLKSNPNPKKPHKPWVSDEYKLVILNRKRSFEY